MMHTLHLRACVQTAGAARPQHAAHSHRGRRGTPPPALRALHHTWGKQGVRISSVVRVCLGHRSSGNKEVLRQKCLYSDLTLLPLPLLLTAGHYRCRPCHRRAWTQRIHKRVAASFARACVGEWLASGGCSVQ
mgnify:CR=1 FL=1